MFLKCFEKEKMFLSQTMPKMNFPLYLPQTFLGGKHFSDILDNSEKEERKQFSQIFTPIRTVRTPEQDSHDPTAHTKQLQYTPRHTAHKTSESQEGHHK